MAKKPTKTESKTEAKTGTSPNQAPNKSSDNGAQPATASQEQARRPRQVLMHAQYVKDLSFENPNAVPAHLKQSQAPQVEIGVNVNGDKINDTQYEVRLHITASAKTEEMALFLVDLTYGGIVSVPEASPEEINPLVMIEGPRLLFPFARSIISNMTRDGGFMPLNLQPVDFVAVYRHSLEKQREAAKSAAQEEAETETKQ